MNKNIKRIFSLVMSMTMMFTLAACDKGSQKASADTEGSIVTVVDVNDDKTPSASKTFKVGICQLVQHDALDAATEGFKAALIEALGDRVEFDEQNASGESANCTTIVNGFIAENVDLILANATPALTAAASATNTIPILGTSISSFSAALELESFNGVVGGNISGTSDLAPLDEQAAMIKEWFPGAKTVGILFCSAEANSVFQVETIRPELEALGLAVEEFSFTDTNDIQAVTTAACEKCDVIYAPTDNMVADNTEAIANICLPARIPVVTGEANACRGCGVCTLSIDYFDIGHMAGEMAAKILLGEADISTMEVGYAPKVTKMFNKENCDALGLVVPDGFVEIQ